MEYGINILHIQRPQRTQRARIACHGGLRQTSTRKAVRRRARLDTTTIGCPAFKETRGRTKRKAEKQCDYERFLTLLRAAVWQSGRLEAEPNAQQRNSATISYAGPYYEWMLIILSGRWQYRRTSKEEAVQQRARLASTTNSSSRVTGARGSEKRTAEKRCDDEGEWTLRWAVV